MKAKYLLVATCLVWAICLCGARAEDTAAKTCDLSSGTRSNEINRVEVSVEVGGNLNLEHAKKPLQLPMSVNLKLAYEERILSFPTRPEGVLRSVRWYDAPSGTRQVGNDKPKPSLGEDRRLMAVEITDSKPVLFSPNSPLDRDELDLVDVPANSLLVDRLLPNKEVRVGDVWEHSQQALAGVLGLDRIESHDIQSKLLEVVGGVARVQLNGKAKGVECGAAAQLEVKAKYQYDLTNKRITWMGLLIREHRETGEAAPSFDVVVRLQMKITPMDKPLKLTGVVTMSVPPQATPKLTQLEHRSGDGLWRVAYGRDWYVVQDDRDLTKLKLLDNGERITQANISSLPKTDAAKIPSLDEFQQDIRRTLETSFGQFVSAGQSANGANYRVYRVVVQGQTQDLPVEWRYYLVANDQGQQVVATFANSTTTSARLNDADRRLVDAIRLTDPKLAAKAAGSKQ